MTTSTLLNGAWIGVASIALWELVTRLGPKLLSFLPKGEKATDTALATKLSGAPLAVTQVLVHHVALTFAAMGKDVIADAAKEGKVDAALATKVKTDIINDLKKTISLETLQTAAAELGLLRRTPDEAALSMTAYVNKHLDQMIAETAATVAPAPTMTTQSVVPAPAPVGGLPAQIPLPLG